MTQTVLWSALERILLTLWVGGLWATGLVFAPLLFAGFGRLLAGEIVGRLLAGMAIIGLVCGSVLLLLAGWRARRHVWRDWRAMVLVLMLLLTLVGEYGLAARMRDLKLLAVHQTDAAPLWAEFGRLHGLASALYLVECLLGLLLVVRGLRPRVQVGS